MKWYLIGALLLLIFALALIALVDGVRAILRRRAFEHYKKPLKLKVATRVDHTNSVFTLTLKPSFWQTLPAFNAGQFLTIRLPIGLNQKVISRRYSLAQWHAKPKTYHLGVRAVEGGLVSNWLHKNAQPEAWVEVLRPSGQFCFNPPASADTHVIFIAAGIGITPIAAMIQHIVALNTPYKATLFHTAREADGLMDAEYFVALAKNQPQFTYQAFITHPNAAHAVLPPHVRAERISATQILAQIQDKSRCEIYMCAGLPMMQALEDALIAGGVARSQIHWESFGSDSSNNGAQFPVTVNQTDFLFQGQPTLLHALEEWGLNINADCRAGDCGACQVTLIEGECQQIQRPQFLLPEQKCLACCVIPQSAIKVEL